MTWVGGEGRREDGWNRTEGWMAGADWTKPPVRLTLFFFSVSFLLQRFEEDSPRHLWAAAAAAILGWWPMRSGEVAPHSTEMIRWLVQASGELEFLRWEPAARLPVCQAGSVGGPWLDGPRGRLRLARTLAGVSSRQGVGGSRH